MLKKVLFPAALAVSLFPISVFAQESGSVSAPTTTPIVDTAGIQSTIINAVAPWLILGLGVGISVVVVWIGWTWIKKFIKSK